MISDIETYFDKGCGRCDRFGTADCSTRRWVKGLTELRNICVQAGLTETVKWGHPCYMHADRNIVIIGALRQDFRISFFNAALMKDPAGVLEKQGPNARHPDMIRFTEISQVAAMAQTIKAYLKEAKVYAEAGIRPPKESTEIDLPHELVDALDADQELAEAFRKLTPGRQRSYVINLASAKTSATRAARIIRFREKILSGKGANER
jgi:uncharacterized protein YdeI (YjbR/CyaY-like superfamily)